jgi:hypothetical protein
MTGLWFPDGEFAALHRQADAAQRMHVDMADPVGPRRVLDLDDHFHHHVSSGSHNRGNGTARPEVWRCSATMTSAKRHYDGGAGRMPSRRRKWRAGRGERSAAWQFPVRWVLQLLASAPRPRHREPAAGGVVWDRE